tara:strand:- start:359 stop:640 length:282 start_codon:yes stop_codon:yes gene_type:complete
MSDEQRQYLTSDQVYELNEKHGWFEFGDAQSDVSRAFANDAIETYERVRTAAPDLLEALEELLQLIEIERPDWQHTEQHRARAAIAKARGTPC